MGLVTRPRAPPTPFDSNIYTKPLKIIYLARRALDTDAGPPIIKGWSTWHGSAGSMNFSARVPTVTNI